MKKAFRILTNKFVLTGLLFLAIMLFFDQNDWFTQHGRVKDLEQTQEKIDHLNGEIERMDKELNGINSSNPKLEQYAREQYHEKKDGEDLYLIVKDTVKAK